MANFKYEEEVTADWNHHGWVLCFQWGKLIHDDKSVQHGYRFIWRKPPKSEGKRGHLQPGRAQARIPSIKEIESLIAKAKAAGWADRTDGLESEFKQN